MEGVLIGILVVWFVTEWWLLRTNAQIRKELLQAHKEMAKMKIQTLTAAARTYFHKYDKFPAKLADLVEPLDNSQPLIETGWKAILDPWGNEHHYRIENENSETGIHIWTVAPDGTRIDNAPE